MKKILITILIFIGTFGFYKTTLAIDYNFNSVKLVKGGTIQGDEKATGLVTNPEAYYPFGGSSDLWGLAFDYTDINASDFGYVVSFSSTLTTHYLKATNFGFSIPEGATINGIIADTETQIYNSAGTYVMWVDHMRVTVYYTEGGGGGDTCTYGGTGDWEVDLADNCHISGYQQIDGALNCFGTGAFVIVNGGEVVADSINCNGLNVKTGGIFREN